MKDVISRNRQRIIGHASNKERLSNNETAYLKNGSRESSIEGMQYEKKIIFHTKRPSVASIGPASAKRLISHDVSGSIGNKGPVAGIRASIPAGLYSLKSLDKPDSSSKMSRPLSSQLRRRLESESKEEEVLSRLSYVKKRMHDDSSKDLISRVSRPSSPQYKADLAAGLAQYVNKSILPPKGKQPMISKGIERQFSPPACAIEGSCSSQYLKFDQIQRDILLNEEFKSKKQNIRMFKPNRKVAKYERNAKESIGDSLNNNYNRFKNMTSKHVYRSKSGKYRIHKVVKTVEEFKMIT